MMKAVILLLSTAVALALPSGAGAQIAVSANDGKQLRPGEAPQSRTADEVAIIDLGQATPEVIGRVAAPTSMIGPPTSVAVAADESFALVTSAQALEGDAIVSNDTVSVIDLADPRAPRVVQTVQAGPGATGVSINRAGTLALVASTGGDAISVFSIAQKQLTPVGTVKMNYQSRPTDVAFSPDGNSAFVVAQNGNEIVRLTVDGTQVRRAGTAIAPGASPYGVVVGRDGRYAYNTNLNGQLGQGNQSGPRIGTISAIDLQSDSLAGSIDVGMTPEHAELSPDGEYLAVVIANGSAAPENSPGYNSYGLLKILRADGANLSIVDEAQTGKWCQGAVWSSDNSKVLLQCGLAKELELYRFDGTTLTRDESGTIKLDARPGAISTANSR